MAAGRRDAAMETLGRLRDANPDFAVVHECIGDIRLADGDYAGYVAAFEQVARLRRNGELLAEAAAQRSALAQGIPALQAVLMRTAEAHLAQNPGQNRVWAAFLASRLVVSTTTPSSGAFAGSAPNGSRPFGKNLG